MDELVAWYRTQLDDEEAAAKEATPGPWKAVDAEEYGAEVYTADGKTAVACSREGGGVGLEDAVHIARHDPAAVLEDVRMKRDLLDEYEAVAHLDTEDPEPEYAHGRAVGLGEAVKVIAAAYRHRPGWRTEWGA